MVAKTLPLFQRMLTSQWHLLTTALRCLTFYVPPAKNGIIETVKLVKQSTLREGHANYRQAWLTADGIPTAQTLGLSAASLTLIVVATVVGFFARHHWIADIFCNLRMQQVIGLLGAVVVLAIGRQWEWVAVAFLLLCIHMPWFAPALFRMVSTGDQNLSSQSELIVMTANVLTSNQRHGDVLSQIESSDADVFAILELATPLRDRLDAELAADYPHQITIPQDGGNFGIGLYSRHPLSDIDSFSTNVDSIMSIAATVETGSAYYRIIATHPLPPVGASGYQSRNEHLEIVGDRVAQFHASNPEMPIIVMGDLNLTPWSPLMNDFESRSGLKLAQGGNEIVPTWYARPFFPFGLVLDHVLISDDLRCIRREIGQDVGSDHRAVVTTIAH